MEKFINKIKKYFNRHKNFNPKIINPNKHWTIILFSFFILTLSLIVFSLYLLIQIKNDNFLQKDQPKNSNQNSMDEELFNRVVKYFENKAQKTEEIKSSAVSIHDPSL